MTADQEAATISKWRAWNEFIQAKPDTGFMQSSWWADFRVTRSWQHFGTVLKDGETIVGGAVVMQYNFAPGKCYYYIPEGPVLPEDRSDAEQVFQLVIEFIERKRKNEGQTVSHLRVEPRWRQIPSFMHGFQEAGAWFEPRDTLYIDLNPTENAILAQMKPKGRYNIGIANRYGVSVVEDTSAQGIADFLLIYEATFNRKGISKKNPAYFHTLIPLLTNLKCGSLFFAEYQNIRLATALVVYFGCRATYFFGASLDIHRNVMAPYLLHFEIMRKARALGHQCYDLWGVAPQNKPEHPWTNISAFKRKLGGQEIALVPTMDYIYDSVSYKEYRNIAR